MTVSFYVNSPFSWLFFHFIFLFCSSVSLQCVWLEFHWSCPTRYLLRHLNLRIGVLNHFGKLSPTLFEFYVFSMLCVMFFNLSQTLVRPCFTRRTMVNLVGKILCCVGLFLALWDILHSWLPDSKCHCDASVLRCFQMLPKVSSNSPAWETLW